jgi:iron complex transport system permease protein
MNIKLMVRNTKWNSLLALLLLTGILFVLNLVFGSVYIPFNELVHAIASPNESLEITRNIVFKSRIPQASTALAAGAGLAVGGLLLQTLFRNPLADPSILGISSGAGLGVALLVMVSGSLGGIVISGLGWIGNFSVTVIAFGGSMVVLLLILNLSRRFSHHATLLIAGIMIAYAAGACIDFLKFFSPKEDVYAFVIWGMGSFANTNASQLMIMIPIILIGLIWSLLMTKSLNILYLGDNYSTNLGLNIRKTRFLVLANTGVLTAVVTAFCGPIAFIGLAVPHLSRGILRTADHAALIPGVILTGASLALFCNLIARLPGFDGTLPVNSVTSVIGAPIVIWVLIKNHRKLNQ